MRKQILTLMVCVVVFALPPAYGMEKVHKDTSHSIDVSQTTSNSSVTSIKEETKSKETTPESFYTLAESFYFITQARENPLNEYGHPTTLTNNFEEDSPFKNQFNNDNQDFEGLQPDIRTMLNELITDDRFMNLIGLFNNGQLVLLNILRNPDCYYQHIFLLTLLGYHAFESASTWRPILTPQNLSPVFDTPQTRADDLSSDSQREQNLLSVFDAPQSREDDLSEDDLFLDSEMDKVD